MRERGQEEVGRGLLDTRELDTGLGDRHTFIGETGFTTADGELNWDADLDIGVLKRLKPPQSPRKLGDLPSLMAFLATFDMTPTGRAVASNLGMARSRLGNAFDQELHGALFGPTSAHHSLMNNGVEEALVEPVFITEAKTLLEHVTGNHGLFRS